MKVFYRVPNFVCKIWPFMRHGSSNPVMPHSEGCPKTSPHGLSTCFVTQYSHRSLSFKCLTILFGSDVLFLVSSDGTVSIINAFWARVEHCSPEKIVLIGRRCGSGPEKKSVFQEIVPSTDDSSHYFRYFHRDRRPLFHFCQLFALLDTETLSWLKIS